MDPSQRESLRLRLSPILRRERECVAASDLNHLKIWLAALRDGPLKSDGGRGGEKAKQTLMQGRVTEKKSCKGEVKKKNSCRVSCNLGLTNCTRLKGTL